MQQSATNRRFLNLYDGSDWQGRPNRGWSLLAEYPDGSAVCTACHAPAMHDSDPAYSNLNAARGLDRRGVHCDYCHKVIDVATLDFGLTHGRFALKLLRPKQGQVFFGPFDDIDRGEDSFAPLYRDSRYCASCHEGTVFGVHAYGTYSEWLASPSARAGKQCQDCHMATSGERNNMAPGHGGIDRDPRLLGNHRFFAPSLEGMLRRSLELTVTTTNVRTGIRVTVELIARDAGHRVPTGFPDRNLVLAIEVFDGAGRKMTPQGPAELLPSEAGKNMAGLAGRLFAKRLRDFEGRQPVPFWRAGPAFDDTRLQPESKWCQDWSFSQAARTIRVRLVYRKFWPEVAQAKGWPNDDIVVVDKQINR